MLKNIGNYRSRAIILLLIVLGAIGSGCRLVDSWLPIEPGLYRPETSAAMAPAIESLEVNREDQLATFHLADGSRLILSFSSRDRSDWQVGCPANIGSTYMEFVDIEGESLSIAGITFKDPVLVRDCASDLERIVLREDGPVGGGGACTNTAKCLRLVWQAGLTALSSNTGPAEQTTVRPTVVQAQPATPAVPPTPMETLPPPAPPAAESTPDMRTLPPARDGLRARLEIPPTLRLGEPVKVQFFLVNDANEDLYVLNWFTPLEGLGGDIFRVRRDGQTVPYQGPLAERTEPTPEAYTLIEVGAIAWAEVDLSRAYDFSLPGNYTIVFNSPGLSHIARSEAEMASSYDELGPIQIPANEVTLTIEEGPRSSVEIEAAREVLARYFSFLNEGRYADAVALYGGGYESLRDWNPTADPQDLATLFERGCTVNGLRCLPVRSITAMGADTTDIYAFVVQFEEPDGSLFVFEPGVAWAEDTFPKSLFEFTVLKSGDSLVVQNLPVYVP